MILDSDLVALLMQSAPVPHYPAHNESIVQGRVAFCVSWSWPDSIVNSGVLRMELRAAHHIVAGIECWTKTQRRLGMLQLIDGPIEFACSRNGQRMVRVLKAQVFRQEWGSSEVMTPQASNMVKWQTLRLNMAMQMLAKLVGSLLFNLQTSFQPAHAFSRLFSSP